MLVILLAALTMPQLVEVDAQVQVPNCRMSVELPAAIQKVMPTLQVVSSHAAANRELRIFLTTDPNGGMQLRFATAERVLLERRLPAAGYSCSALADAIALILERFMVDLGWSGRAPIPATELPPLPQTPAAQGPAPTPSDTRSTKLHGGLGVNLGYALETPLGGGGGIGVYTSWLAFDAGLGLNAARFQEQLIYYRTSLRGTLSLANERLFVHAGGCIGTAYRGCLRGFAGLDHWTATAHGAGIYAATTARSWQPVVGGSVGYLIEMTDIFLLTGDIWVALRPQDRGFTIVGARPASLPNQAGTGFAIGVRMQLF